MVNETEKKNGEAAAEFIYESSLASTKSVKVENFGIKKLFILFVICALQTAGFIISLRFGFGFAYAFLSLILVNFYNYKHYYDCEKKIIPYYLGAAFDYVVFVMLLVSYPLIIGFLFYIYIENYNIVSMSSDFLAATISESSFYEIVNIPNLLTSSTPWITNALVLSICIGFINIFLSAPLWLPMSRGWVCVYKSQKIFISLSIFILALYCSISLWCFWPITNVASPNTFFEDYEFIKSKLNGFFLSVSLYSLFLTAVIGFMKHLLELRRAQTNG